MNIAIFLNVKCSYYKGEYWVEEPDYLFWLAITQPFPHIYLCLSTEKSNRPGNFKIEMNPDRVTVIPLPGYHSSLQLYQNLPTILSKTNHIMNKFWNDIDFLTAVVPNPIGLFLTRMAKKQKLPCALYIRGNLIQTVRHEYLKSKLKWPAIGLAYLLEFLTRRLIKNTHTFVVGEELSSLYRLQGLETVSLVTSLISKADIVPTKQLNVQPQFRLLYVGRFSKEKGLDTLMEALRLLQQQEMPIHLELIGFGAEQSYLKQVVETEGLAVTFSGFIPVGKELNQKYQSSDLFVLPSYTEGFPKVLIEAMANGCPIVTTNVGSIPQYMTHNQDCLMVPALNAKRLAKGIEEMLLSTELREKIRNNALLTAENFCIERSAQLFLEHVRVEQTRYN